MAGPPCGLRNQCWLFLSRVSPLLAASCPKACPPRRALDQEPREPPGQQSSLNSRALSGPRSAGFRTLNPLSHRCSSGPWSMEQHHGQLRARWRLPRGGPPACSPNLLIALVYQVATDADLANMQPLLLQKYRVGLLQASGCVFIK